MGLIKSSDTADAVVAIRGLGTLSNKTNLIQDDISLKLVSPRWHRLGKTRFRRFIFRLDL